MYSTSAMTSTSPSKAGKLFALCAAAAYCAVAASSAMAAPTLINGSLTGPVANAQVPPGWTVVTISPDTNNTSNNQGTPTMFPFVATPSASPDGGTWVGFGTTTTPVFPVVTVESFSQTVSGFTIGRSYTLQWYHANFGATLRNGPQYTAADANAVEVIADGESIGSGSMLSLGTAWVDEGFTFVAMDTSIDLTFTSLNKSVNSYQSIDGIRLTELPPIVVPPTNAVPEPAALSLFSGAGLAMLLAGRRRKQAPKAA